MPDTWEGFKFQLIKPLHSSLSIEHTFSLGSTAEPPHYHYSFTFQKSPEPGDQREVVCPFIFLDSYYILPFLTF